MRAVARNPTPRGKGGAGIAEEKKLDERWPVGLAAEPPDRKVTRRMCVAQLAENWLPDDVTFASDVVYGTAGRTGRGITCDIYGRADPSDVRPAVVLLHGGGWWCGDKSMLAGYAHALAVDGYVTVTAAYRLSAEAPFPAALEDAKCVVRWLRAHAERYGVDPSRIAVAGNSAGGHLAAMVALTPGRHEGTGGWGDRWSGVAGAFLLYPVTSIHDLAAVDPSVEEKVLDFVERPDWTDASPTHHVHGEAPPIRTLQGEADEMTPLAMVMRFHHALLATGATSELVVLTGQPHAFDAAIDGWMVAYGALVSFLEDTLATASPTRGEQELCTESDTTSERPGRRR